jgi:transcriptional regulator
MSGPFDQYGPGDVRDLIAEYPLAWVTAAPSAGASDRETAPRASLLPLLGEYDGEGRLVSLLGHMARRNPLHARPDEPMAVTILITGPHGYVSPRQAEKPDWGPSWNYAQLVIDAELTFLPDETAPAITALVEMMEDGRWTTDQLGARYVGLLGAIVGFRARVRTLSATFKLGQDESRPVFEALCRNHPDPALVRWMRRFAA